MSKSTAPRPLRVFAALLCSAVLASACGGGAVPGVPPVVSPTPNADDPIENTALPDFSVLNLVGNSVDSIFDAVPYTASATIINDGDASGTVPGGWLLVSMDPDFVDDYEYMPVKLVPLIPSNGTELEPGESRTFALSNAFAATHIRLSLRRSGTHYLRLWINPDLSARFINPEDHVAPSYTDVEKSYDNNLSDLMAFDRISRPSSVDCSPDNHETNDSLGNATPIEFGIAYTFNGCDEALDVLSVNLTAGSSYELFQDPTRDQEAWRITVIEPNGNYLIRDIKFTTTIITNMTGIHYISTAYGIGTLAHESATGRDLLFEVRER